VLTVFLLETHFDTAMPKVMVPNMLAHLDIWKNIDQLLGGDRKRKFPNNLLKLFGVLLKIFFKCRTKMFVAFLLHCYDV